MQESEYRILIKYWFYKDERPTSNIERPMLNENKKPIPNYFCFFILLNSKFDVGRSMFDVHLFPSIKTIQRFTKFCILYSLIHIRVKAP